MFKILGKINVRTTVMVPTFVVVLAVFADKLEMKTTVTVLCVLFFALIGLAAILGLYHAISGLWNTKKRSRRFPFE